SKVAQDNFDDDDDEDTSFGGPVDRFALYDKLGNVGWKGCVEARNHVQGENGLYYDTSDLPPARENPDSLFAPAFAPDEPDSGGFPNSYLDDTPASCECKSGRSGPVEWDEIDWSSIDWENIDWGNIDWANLTWEDLGLASCELSNRELQ